MTLDEQYQKVIDDQRAHLMEVQEVFNEECKKIKETAKAELANIPKEDKEAQEEVLSKEKAELSAALDKLRGEVDHSTRGTMKKLEQIVSMKEGELLKEIEQEIANL